MIESYEFGRIVVDGETYESDVIIFPDHVRSSWWRRAGHELCLEDLTDALEADPEILVVGKGASGLMRILDEVKTELERRRIELRSDSTSKACDIYNNVSPRRKAVAALHLTC